MELFRALFSVETPPTFGWGAFVMLRKGTAQTRAMLHILTRGDILAIVRTDVPMTSALCEETILKLVDTYPFQVCTEEYGIERYYPAAPTRRTCAMLHRRSKEG